ncbi:hypothetical protein [Priestia flexa]|uniref:hypothetical protein n=1 Tax=Priestia flexa TaxID=86664 RepID=UPI0013632895|nr:hypothetical protein [Priestia flexa]
MEWSVGHSTPAGREGKLRSRSAARSSGSSPRKASGRSAMERTCSDKLKRWEQLVFVF